MANTKVLVADVPEEDEKIRECLPDHQLVFVRTLSDAIRALRANGYRLVVIGMHFDESRMFELLQFTKALPAYKDVPVICVQCLEMGLAQAVLRTWTTRSRRSAARHSSICATTRCTSAATASS
jgi:PleD family two-component response regulator